MNLRTALTVVLGIASPSTALASAGICLEAAYDAAARHQVPAPILVTIARAESGKGPQRLPWPWTLNAAGRGQHFASKAAALEAFQQRRDRGETNLDIGCFQLNFRWHGAAFASAADMIDPARNADHAARFLRDLYRETGDWKTAAGAYHSRTGQLANRYVLRLERIFSDGTPGGGRRADRLAEGGAGPEIGPETGRETGLVEVRPEPSPGAEPRANRVPAAGLMGARPPLALAPVRPLAGSGA